MWKTRFVVLLLALCVAAMAQTRVLLYDFEARNIDVSVIRTNTQVMRDALNGTYKYLVIDPAPGTFCYNVLAAADSAKKYGAAQALVGNIMAIGGKQFLTYQLVDAASGNVLLADKLDLPPVDEFPTMAGRIARSVVEKKPYAETAEPDAMTTSEVGPRIKRPRQPYAGLLMTAGYNYLFVQRTESYLSNRLVNLNVAVSFEMPHLLTMLQIGYMRGIHDERDIAFDLFTNYVQGSGDFAPFYGGGIGITRFLWNQPDPKIQQDNDALMLSAGGGVIGLRTYYFRMIAAVYANLAIPANQRHDWGMVPGMRVMFGVSSPSFGPDATIKTGPGCVGAAIGAIFLTGLVVMLTG